LIIRNGKILINDSITTEKDIRLEGGLISRIDRNIKAGANEEVIDARGRYILPGFIDIHTHLDDNIGKYNLADDFYSGSLVAAINGITTLYNFITERTDRPLKSAVREFLKKGKNSVVNYGFHLTPVKFGVRNFDYIKRLIETGFNSFKFYTTYKNAGIYLPYEEIERVVEQIKDRKTVFLVHCEDEEILSEYYCYQYSEPYDHFRFRPAEAEVVAIKNIIRIARETNARFHIVHCSSREGAKVINSARAKLNITLETCPQYLVLSNEYLKTKDGHRYFCTPPVRDEKNRTALMEMAGKGVFDIFATDHAPFRKRDKDENRRNLRGVPNGLAGLGALSHIIYKILKEAKRIPFAELSKRLSENPARIMKIYPKKGTISEGSDADLLILSESTCERKIRPSLTDSYNPYKDFTSNLRFDYVIIGGVVVVRNGRIINNRFRGRCLNVSPEGIQE